MTFEEGFDIILKLPDLRSTIDVTAYLTLYSVIPKTNKISHPPQADSEILHFAVLFLNFQTDNSQFDYYSTDERFDYAVKRLI